MTDDAAIPEGFVVFERPKLGRRPGEGAPTVSLRKDGTFGLNGPAFDAMGRPDAVRLSYAEAERLVGFSPAAAGDRGAYRPTANGRSLGRNVNGRAFCRRFGIEIGRTRRYPAAWRDDRLVIDLSGNGENGE